MVFRTIPNSRGVFTSNEPTKIILVFGVILLFIGVAVQPSVATVQPEKINITPDVEGLIAQLRVVVNEILHKYEYNPMVAYLCNYILGIIDNFIFGAVCILLLIIFIPVEALLILLGLILRNHSDDLFFIAIMIALTWDTTCARFFNDLSLQSLKSISTLTDTNDITNLADECPCMQQ